MDGNGTLPRQYFAVLISEERCVLKVTLDPLRLEGVLF